METAPIAGSAKLIGRNELATRWSGSVLEELDAGGLEGSHTSRYPWELGTLSIVILFLLGAMGLAWKTRLDTSLAQDRARIADLETRLQQHEKQFAERTNLGDSWEPMEDTLSR